MVFLQAVSSLFIVGKDRSQDLTWELTDPGHLGLREKEMDSIRATIPWILTGYLGLCWCFPCI